MKKQVKQENNISLDATHLDEKDGIYAVTNAGVEILMYIQIFILVKTAFF